MKTYLVTGGAGFIGTNFVKHLLKYQNIPNIVVLDKLTYAGKRENLEEEIHSQKIDFIQGDIGDKTLVETIFLEYNIDYVVNFAAESHVDNSIENPRIFFETNVLGTQNLLEVAKKNWSVGKDQEGYPVYRPGKKFVQISTDEVYGSLSRDYQEGKEVLISSILEANIPGRRKVKIYGDSFFHEDSPLQPNSPYSVSKAAADLLVLSYFKTYKFPVNITRCSNNYGPYQFPEKLIPFMIGNIVEGKKLPLYGDGFQVRDWIHVEDHVKAVNCVIQSGKIGEIYNIGSLQEETNRNIVMLLLESFNKLTKEEKEDRTIETIAISYVQDRLGHDGRYAINPKKIIKELEWFPEMDFEKGIENTVYWYLENKIQKKELKSC